MLLSSALLWISTRLALAALVLTQGTLLGIVGIPALTWALGMLLRESNPEAARRRWERLLDAGDGRSATSLALLPGLSDSARVAYFRRGAALHDPASEGQLSGLFAMGEAGLPLSLDSSLYWMKRAHRHRHNAAMALDPALDEDARIQRDEEMQAQLRSLPDSTRARYDAIRVD